MANDHFTFQPTGFRLRSTRSQNIQYLPRLYHFANLAKGVSYVFDAPTSALTAPPALAPGSSHHRPVTTIISGDGRNPDRLRLALIAISLLTSESLQKAERARLDKAKIEEIHQEFDALKARVRTLHFNWDLATATTLEEYRTPALEHVAVRLRVQISAIEKAVQVEIPLDEEPDIIELLSHRPEDFQQGKIKTLRTTVTIMGETGQDEELLPITDRQLIEKLVHDRFSAAYFEVLAIVVTPPVIEGTRGHAQIVKPYSLLAVDIRPLTTALQLAAPTPGELQAVDQELRSISNPMLYIMDKVIRYLGVKGLERLTILNEAIEFQILAALTEGPRASTAVIGPPGAGKHIIGVVATLLQVISREALPTKVTEAGLIGLGHSSAKKDIRKAGFLPQADQGVFIVQDWNQANTNKNQRLTSALATAMQDGKVHDTSASQCSYRTEISVVIDANRQSDVRRTETNEGMDGLDQFVADTKLPTNLLTRFTYVAEITRSVEDQIQTLGLVLAAAGERREKIQAEMKKEMRYIRVWLARLRDVHREVTIPEDVVARMNQRCQEAINVCATRLPQRGEYGDFMVRLAEQTLMLVQAHARLHSRSMATVADVDGIYPYLHRKMSFVRSLLFGADTAASDVKASAPGRQTLIKLRLKAGQYTAKQVQRQLCLTSCSVSAVEDDLRALFGNPDEGGAFHVGA